MASLDGQKISLEAFAISPYNSISYDPEKRSKCCIKTLKNGQKLAKNGPENPKKSLKRSREK